MEQQIASLNEWEIALGKKPFYSFLHTPAWAMANLRVNPSIKVKIYSIPHEDGAPLVMPLMEQRIGGVLKSTESILGGYGGLICNRTFTPIEIKNMIDLVRPTQTTLFQINPHPCESIPLKPLLGQGFIAKKTSAHILKLDEASRLWQKLAQPIRSSILIAQQKGFEVTEGSADDVEPIFSSLYSAAVMTSPKRHCVASSLPLINTLIQQNPGKARIFFAGHRGKKLCGLIMLYGRGEAFLFEAGYRYCVESYHANNLLWWTMISDASDSGYSMLNFGASPSAAVKKYKEMFGAEVVNYDRYVFNNWAVKVRCMISTVSPRKIGALKNYTKQQPTLLEQGSGYLQNVKEHARQLSAE
jgi:hypothetical protein